MKKSLLLILVTVLSVAVSPAQNALLNQVKKATLIASLPYASSAGTCGTKGFSTCFWQFTTQTTGLVTISMETGSNGVALTACAGDPFSDKCLKLGEQPVTAETPLRVAVMAGESVYIQAFSAAPFSYSSLNVSAPMAINDGKQMPLAQAAASNKETVLSLSADPTASAVRLNWTAASGKHIQGFEVQRSSDAKTFASIGWIDSRSGDKAGANYEMVDTSASEGTMYFYRLRMLDNEHNSAFSHVTPAVIKNKGIVIYDVYGSKDEKGSYLRYILSRPTVVTVEITDPIGNVVKKYQQGMQTAGTYTVPFPGEPSDFREGKLKIDLWCDEDKYAITNPDGE